MIAPSRAHRLRAAVLRRRAAAASSTQFDKDDVEAAGLVKFDFLGLRTLTIIDWAVAHHQRRARARRRRGAARHGDAAADGRRGDLRRCCKRCETTAVFQLESRGMKDLIRRLQPDCFEDIVALVALFRPGPLQSGMVDDFIAAQSTARPTRADRLSASAARSRCSTPTYGVILYQEQVMQIAQVLAGYTLGGADLLRRAMGKKKPEEMAQQRSVFVDGAARVAASTQAAPRHIFDLMEKFAGYGFNKSHSAAYALLSYQTGVAQGALPGGVHGGGAVVRHGQDRQGRDADRRSAAAWALGASRPTSTASRFTSSPPAASAASPLRAGAIKGVGQSVVAEMLVGPAQGGAWRVPRPRRLVPAARPESK